MIDSRFVGSIVGVLFALMFLITFALGLVWLFGVFTISAIFLIFFERHSKYIGKYFYKKL